MTRTTKMLAALALAACLVPAVAHAQPPPAPGPAPTETAPPATTAPPAETTTPPPVPPPSTSPPPTAPPPMESKVKPAAPKAAVEHKITAPIIAAGVISGVALVGGVVFALKAASAHSNYTSDPNPDDANSGEQASFVADVAFGFSALFAFGAVMLYILPDESTGAAASNRPRRSAVGYVKSALGGGLHF